METELSNEEHDQLTAVHPRRRFCLLPAKLIADLWPLLFGLTKEPFVVIK
jgi:hypothetical protein